MHSDRMVLIPSWSPAHATGIVMGYNPAKEETAMHFHFNFPPAKLLRRLLALVGFMALASLVGQYATFFYGDGHMQGFVPLFNLDREMNIPTWFSSICFLFAAVLLWQLSKSDVASSRRFWRGLSMVFVFFSLDECAAIHEMAVDPMRQFFHAHGLLHFAWVIPGMAFVGILVALYLRFFLAQPMRGWFLASAVLFFSGTFGLEMLGGRYVEMYGDKSFTYALISNCEETLELIGLVLFLHALLLSLTRLQSAKANGAR
jgi:hypothetical protein